MTIALRNAVEAYGQTKLGIRKEEIGTHSLRSGAAMALYLGECPVYVIMMIGRWSSDAFLSYIRKQVEQFSHKVSSKMLRFQFHRHIPDREIRKAMKSPKQCRDKKEYYWQIPHDEHGHLDPLDDFGLHVSRYR